MAPKDNFFQRLTKLFRSGPSIQRKVKGYDYKNAYDRSLANRSLGYRGPAPFGKESSPFSVLGGYGILDRISRYAEYSAMEQTAEISAAMDVYADETCASDEKGQCLHVYSENAEIKNALEDLFYDTMNAEFNLRPWVRNLVKYGDFFTYQEVVPDVGIINVVPIPVNELEREEGFDLEDPYAVRFRWLTRGNKILENWQVTHFRLLGNDLMMPYGTSILEAARRIFRVLNMLEDTMMVYRITRSAERRVFYIDVGNTAPNDIPSYMEAAKKALRSSSVMDKTNGREDMRYNPIAIDEDYFLAVRGETGGTRIETLAGGQHVSATEDVEYFQNKLFAALKVPKAYLNYDEGISSKATLSAEDVRFSRTISILQKIIVAELNKLAMIHLYAKGFDGEDLTNFELFLSNPSSIAVQQKLALWNDRFDIVGKAKESALVPEEWLQREILGFTPEEIDKFKHARKEDVLFLKELETIAVSSENQERQATVDPFDQSNYSVPGAGVEKVSRNVDPKMGDDELKATIVKFDAEGGIINSDTPPGKTPIQASNYVSSRRDRKTSMDGRSNAKLPDFARMFDMSGKNQYNMDPFDTKSQKHKARSRMEAMEIDLEKVLKTKPTISPEMKKLFASFDKKFNRTKETILLEGLEARLDAEFSYTNEPLKSAETPMILIEDVIENTDPTSMLTEATDPAPGEDQVVRELKKALLEDKD